MGDTKEQRTAIRSTPWAVLRNRDFVVLWSATFISNAGSWMQKIATGWLVYDMTGSKALLGLEAFAGGMTTVALLPIGGVIADRVDRRRLLIVTNMLCAAITLGLSILAFAGQLHVWHIIAASALTGVVLAAQVPASTSLLPALVGESLVPNAIALNSLQFNLSRAIGPMLGGFTLASFGAGWCFAANTASFLAIVAALFVITKLPSRPADKQPLWPALIGGIHYVRSRRQQLALPIVSVAAGAFLAAPVISLLPALTMDVLGRSAQSYSTLVSAFGVGAIIAAAAATLLGDRFSDFRSAAALLALTGAMLVSLALSKDWSLGIALVGVAGFGFVGSMIRFGTLILANADDAHRGRVTSLQQMAFRIGQPVGALVAGAIAQRVGTALAFAVCGGLLVATLAAAIIAGSGTDDRRV